MKSKVVSIAFDQSDTMYIVCQDGSVHQDQMNKWGEIIPPFKAPKKDPKPGSITWGCDTGFQNITLEDLKEWVTIYPNCDVEKELKKMNNWLLGNPSKANKKLWRKFITNWLARESAKGYRPNIPSTTPLQRSRVEPPEEMLKQAYTNAFPADQYPNMPPFDDSMKFWQFDDEDRYKMKEAHQPLKEWIEK